MREPIKPQTPPRGLNFWVPLVVGVTGLGLLAAWIFNWPW